MHTVNQIVAVVFLAFIPINTWAAGHQVCNRPVYLTFEAGDMSVAPVVAEVLKRQGVRVTFFAANERTRLGDSALGAYWAPWWKARAAEGHEFASNTYDHVSLRSDLPGVRPTFRVRLNAGAFQGREFTWTPEQYCAQLNQASARLQDHTGKAPLPLFRAPGGKTSKKLIASAQSCGYVHVGWSPAGLLGDELPSGKYSNAALLVKALRDVRAGDVLVAHLGVGSRQDPWAPAVLEPLIVGLKERGYCFSTLRDHPAYQSWIVMAGSPLLKFKP